MDKKSRQDVENSTKKTDQTNPKHIDKISPKHYNKISPKKPDPDNDKGAGNTAVAERTLEQDIIALYDNNLVALYSINEIAGKLGKKYPYINKKVNDMIREAVLNYMVVGRSYLCSLNLSNPKTILLLTANQIDKRSSGYVQDQLTHDQAGNQNKGQEKSVQEKQGREKSGSKARQQEDEDVLRFAKKNLLRIALHSVIRNDGRLIFVVENLRDRHEIERLFPKAAVLDRTEFLDILLEDRQLYSDHVVLYGHERFYELVRYGLDSIKRAYSPLRY